MTGGADVVTISGSTLAIKASEPWCGGGLHRCGRDCGDWEGCGVWGGDGDCSSSEVLGVSPGWSMRAAET